MTGNTHAPSVAIVPRNLVAVARIAI